MKTTTTLKLSQIWKDVTGKYEIFKYQNLRPIINATRKNIFAKQDLTRVVLWNEP